VNPGGPLSTAMADRLKALVGLYPNLRFARVFQNDLVDNFGSTKREIWCYGGNGHRRPPLDMFFLGRKNLYP
jgi:hypothetical protein